MGKPSTWIVLSCRAVSHSKAFLDALLFAFVLQHNSRQSVSRDVALFSACVSCILQGKGFVILCFVCFYFCMHEVLLDTLRYAIRFSTHTEEGCYYMNCFNPCIPRLSVNGVFAVCFLISYFLRIFQGLWTNIAGYSHALTFTKQPFVAYFLCCCSGWAYQCPYLLFL